MGHGRRGSGSNGALACLLLVVSLVGCTTPARMTVDERAWIQVDTPNFTIWTCVDERHAVRFAQHMELFRSVATFVIGGALPAGMLPIRTILFPDMDTYAAFAPSGSAGVYLPSTTRNVMLATASTGAGNHVSTHVIQHEYVHFLLDNHAAFVYPAWYHEGFAEFLGATRFRANDVELGGASSLGTPVLSYRGRDLWTHVRDLLGFGVGGHEGEGVRQRYQQSWALVHYLYSGRTGMGGGKARVARYLKAVAGGASIDDAVARGFGMSVDQLDRALRAYVERGHYPGAIVRRAEFPPAPTPTVTRVDRAEIAVELGFIARRFGNPREARNYFDRALADRPGDPDALTGQALLLADDEQFEAAEERLVEALAAAPEDPDVQRIAGEYFFWRARDDEAEADARARFARRARKHYVKSWKLDDSVPGTYAGYGATFLVEGQDAVKGIATLERAHQLLPNSVQVMNWLAQAYWKSGRSEEARTLALTAYSSPIYGSEIGKTDFDLMKKLLRETGGLPRDPDMD